MMGRPTGPDQPYAWVIAVASFIINTILSGITRATGIFYVALIEVYGVTRFEANMPFTLRICFRNLAGPLVGLLGQRYGVRIISVIGAVLAVAGASLCGVAPNIFWVSFFWGLFHGLGVALGNTLFQVSINQYFVKYRATAAGLALSGACIGSFIFPVTLEAFLNSYGLQGAFLLTGGIVMQAIPASLVLNEPPWIKLLTEKYQKPRVQEKKVNRLEPIPEDIHRRSSAEIEENETDENDVFASEKCRNIINLSLDMKSTEANLDAHSAHNETSNNRANDLKEIRECQDLEAMLSAIRCRTISVGEVSVTVSSKLGDQNTPGQELPLLKALLKVYKNPMFHMISISLAAFGTLFDPLMTVIVDYITDKGLNENVGKYLISVLALGDLIGRLCFGWITDKNFISIPRFMMIIQVIQGICFGLLPLFYTFEVLMGLIILYGITAGINIVMNPLLIAKYIPSEQSIAMGSVTFLAGIVSFAVPPLIGHFRDNKGSYDGMFYICAALSILSGLMWLLEPWVVNFSNRTSSINQSERNS